MPNYSKTGKNANRGKKRKAAINQVMVVPKPQEKRPPWRPRSFDNADELYEKGKEYIETWEEANRPLTMAGLTLYLGITRATWHEYSTGKQDKSDANFSNACELLKTYIEMQKFEKALKGEYVAPVAMFDLKFNHGYVDNSEPEKKVKKMADINVEQITDEQAFNEWKDELKLIKGDLVKI